MHGNNEIIMQAMHTGAKPEQSLQICRHLLARQKMKEISCKGSRQCSQQGIRLLKCEDMLSCPYIAMCLCTLEIQCLSKQWLFRYRDGAYLFDLYSVWENLNCGLLHTVEDSTEGRHKVTSEFNFFNSIHLYPFIVMLYITANYFQHFYSIKSQNTEI